MSEYIYNLDKFHSEKKDKKKKDKKDKKDKKNKKEKKEKKDIDEQFESEHVSGGCPYCDN